MNVKPVIHYLLSRIFSAIHRIIPKNDETIMFISTPDFSDNPRHLYETAREKLVNYKFIWVVHDKEKFKPLESENTIFVQYRTIEYLKWITRAKYLVLSHGVPYWKAGNQIAILLWHGIPLKAMGKFSSQLGIPFWRKRALDKTDFFITISEFAWLLFISDIQFVPKKVLYLGQPRCDVLLSSVYKAEKLYRRVLGIDPSLYSNVMMYLPTFRDYDIKATQRLIGEIINNPNFIEFLSRNDLLFIIKPHPRDESIFEKYESTHIKVIKNRDLLSNFTTLYDLLPAVDVLITDYSSVYFDYLLLNRPIVFYIPDLEKYRETRGFLLEPYEKWTPGDKARTVDELIWALKEAINNPEKWEQERAWLRDVMFKYQDGKASERIIKYFWGDV